MFKFQISTMDCGHCASAITKAVKTIDPLATIKVDLATQTVRVEGVSGAEEIEEAINSAGYTAVRYR